MAQSRQSYLRATGGKRWGRPLNGVVSKYLLTGLGRCGTCGGSFEVQSRSHGGSRAYFYVCANYYRRGPSVCPNGLAASLDRMDTAVLGALEPLLTQTFIETVVRKVLTRAMKSGSDLDEARSTITSQADKVRRELDNLIDALAKTGGSSRVTDAIKDREARLSHLEQDLAALEGRQQISQMDAARLERQAREKVAGWRKVLRAHPSQARQIVSKLLRDRLIFIPETRNRRPGYRFRGEGTIWPLLSGVIHDLDVCGKRWRPQRDSNPCFGLERATS
jgi:site-specific DNA recombinase